MSQVSGVALVWGYLHQLGGSALLNYKIDILKISHYLDLRSIRTNFARCKIWFISLCPSQWSGVSGVTENSEDAHHTSGTSADTNKAITDRQTTRPTKTVARPTPWLYYIDVGRALLSGGV